MRGPMSWWKCSRFDLCGQLSSMGVSRMLVRREMGLFSNHLACGASDASDASERYSTGTYGYAHATLVSDTSRVSVGC